MHILIVPSWYKSEANPILGSFFEEQARMLLKRGHNVKILYPYTIKFRQVKNTQQQESVNNGLYEWHICFYSPKYKSAVNNTIKNRHFIVRLMDEYINRFGKPDIIHAHSVYPAGIIAYEISKTKNIPYIITEHLSTLANNNISLVKKIKQFFVIDKNKHLIIKSYRNSNSLTTVSNSLKELIIEKYHIEKKIDIIPNLVPDFFWEDEYSGNKKHDIFTIIFIGGLTTIKNPFLLLESIRLVSHSENIKLQVIGEGVLKNKLQKYAEKTGISHLVEFHGRLAREKVREVLSKSHLLVSTSTFETFGVTIIEGLAKGIPVVATNSGGPEDIIQMGDGVLVENHNAEDVASAILNIIKNYDFYDAKEISKRCRDRFSEDTIYNITIKHYLDILK